MLYVTEKKKIEIMFFCKVNCYRIFFLFVFEEWFVKVSRASSDCKWCKGKTTANAKRLLNDDWWKLHCFDRETQDGGNTLIQEGEIRMQNNFISNAIFTVELQLMMTSL